MRRRGAQILGAALRSSGLSSMPKHVRSQFSWKLRLLLLSFVYVLCPLQSLAQTSDVNSAALIADERGVTTAPVIVDGRVLFRVRGVSAFPAEQRADAIASRIRAAAADRTIAVQDLRLDQGQDSTDILADDARIMSVFDADANAEAHGLRQRALAQIYVKKIGAAIESYRLERTPEQLTHGILVAGCWTVALVLVTFVLFRTLRWIVGLIERRYEATIEHIESGTFRLISAGSIWLAIRFVSRLLALVAVFAAWYTYLHIVLGLFPWTRSFASNLRDLTLAPLQQLASELLSSIPQLVIIFLIVLAARYLIRLARLFFSAVENGGIKLSGFEVEWADPTYNIVRLLIVAFAAMVCYPYIPGSQSAAFKGMTIFIGVLFSLGSSSLLANLIAGYTMTYRRAFHVGDRIRVGELTGDVSQVRLMVTHLRSIKNEELVVPNSVILGSSIINFSALAREKGLILHTTVGIGYETPWRQVEAMLLMSATRTPGLLRKPTPYVLQKSLGDYAVNYELNVYCDDALQMYRLYTELHRNILDVFNEYNVQIMTPSYVADPAAPKIVPTGQWFAMPAQLPSQDNSKSTK